MSISTILYRQEKSSFGEKVPYLSQTLFGLELYALSKVFLASDGKKWTKLSFK
jgi:hypothetical protein